ncbi:MAG: adenylate/guanylate cyclase domain-containing protein [Balneolaceae bacterium]
MQSLKGFGFVGISSLLIFSLIWKNNAMLNEAIDDLKKSRDKFQATFNQAPVGIIHHRPDEKLLEVNQTLCKLLGYEEAELRKLDFSKIIHPDDLNKGRDLDRRLYEGQLARYSIEKSYIRKDGSSFPGLLHKSAVYNGQDGPVYLVGIIEDISQLKKTEQELRHSLNTFRKFVPEEFLEYLNKNNIWDIRRGDKVEKTFTVMFTDIRSYTSLSENMTDQENFEFISSFIYKVAPAIRKHHGFIDKFIGDAIMALFPGKSDHAIQSALDIQKAVGRFNENLINQGNEPIEVGIGMNTGSLVLGTLGDSKRLQTTVLSDHVNIASRIEDLTKVYKAPILISENTYNNLENKNRYTFRRIEKIKLEGRLGETILYELTDGNPADMTAD